MAFTTAAAMIEPSISIRRIPMLYLFLKFAHLTAATFFIGGVFFEVMILSRATRELPDDAKAGFSRALGRRARQVMHWVVLALYGAGLGLAWHYRAALHAPLASSFGILLSLKITLALSILGHFLLVVFLMRSGRMTAVRSRRIHLSVLLQMLGILFLAKAMFLLNL
ncbi:hypothetical protein EQ836_17600 [Ectopseudomonas mendocina]|uniref:Integral membrane protein n=2 Tax=Ectopseudomonas mendocina TaxID=300 RepID=A0ABD7RT29_ECTME|nr:hypothetical protein EQ829_13385 [Pseudomonas mendocina]TRO15712.1 hypothetical protein EQ836_17600 [Pseudomonas mendocina]